MARVPVSGMSQSTTLSEELMLTYPLATITLVDIDGIDSVPVREVILTEPHWQINIGRGTMSGDEGRRPAEDNAWFDSRVMSRNHAVLRADPHTMVSPRETR